MQDLYPVVSSQFGDRFENHKAGIVYDNVQPAKFCDRRINGAFDGRFVRHIALDGERVRTAIIPNSFGGLFGAVAVEISNNCVTTFFGKRLSGSTAYTTGAARYNDRFTVEQHLHFPLRGSPEILAARPFLYVYDPTRCFDHHSHAASLPEPANKRSVSVRRHANPALIFYMLRRLAVSCGRDRKVQADQRYCCHHEERNSNPPDR